METLEVKNVSCLAMECHPGDSVAQFCPRCHDEAPRPAANQRGTPGKRFPGSIACGVLMAFCLMLWWPPLSQRRGSLADSTGQVMYERAGLGKIKFTEISATSDNPRFVFDPVAHIKPVCHRCNSAVCTVSV